MPIRMMQQCTTPDGQTGTYLFSKEIGKVLSPVFADTVEFYQWLKANDWEHFQPKGESNPLIGAYRKKQSYYYGN